FTMPLNPFFVQDEYGNTPFHYACICKHTALVKEMAEMSPLPVNVKNLKGRTPLVAMLGSYTGPCHEDTIVRKNGAKFGTNKEKIYAMCQIATILLDHGANVNEITHEGNRVPFSTLNEALRNCHRDSR